MGTRWESTRHARPVTSALLLLGCLLVAPAGHAQDPAKTSGASAKSEPAINTGSAKPDGRDTRPAVKNTSDAKPAKPAPAADDWRRSKLPPDLAFAAYQRGRFITAFREATKRIEAGGPHIAAAMTLIGELYRDGLGFRQDPASAARWYALAAKRGDAQAAFALGRAYLRGNGVKKDKAKALTLFKEAASKGNSAALYNLGIAAIEPLEKNRPAGFEKAAEYFARSAYLGNLDAAYALATLYRKGLGVPQNDIKAASLLKEAADQHHLDSLTEYAIALFNGRGVKKDETEAARYMIRAAWRNSPVAQNRLARMFAAGRGVKRDRIQAMTWHIIARASGVKDKWLDSKLPLLTATQRKIVYERVRKFARK